MAKYRISQFGKQTVRYSFTEAMKVMHDRRLTKGDKGLLRITCDGIAEAESILSNKLYNPKCTMIFAYYDSTLLYWFNREWVESDKFFKDEYWSVEPFVPLLRDDKINRILDEISL